MSMSRQFAKACICALACLALGGTTALADEPPGQRAIEEEAYRIVSQHKGVFASPPKRVPTRKAPDGPIIGNGDLGVVISGPPARQRLWISKNDFWKSKPIYPNAGPRPIGGIDVAIDALAGGTYQAEQVLQTAEIQSTFTTTKRMGDPPPFTRAGVTIKMRSWVPATENLLVVELSVAGDAQDVNVLPRDNMVGVEVTLWPATGDESETAGGNLDDGYWVTRKYVSTDRSVAIEKKPLAWPSGAAVAMRLLNHRKMPRLTGGDGWSSDRFIIGPGEPVTIVASIVTNHEADDPLEVARKRVEKITPEQIESLRESHRQWWRDFWSKSFIEIGDKQIEKFWYGSHYIMACCSRNKDFPPGLFGNWTTTNSPSWQADYHLNYNHQAPWWGVFSSNHVELSEPYDAPILAYLPTGKANAKEFLKCRGVYYDVGIGPRGLETSFQPEGHSIPGEGNRLFLGAKSNAAFASANMFMRFYHTYDRQYAEKVYPYLIEVANFWEDYLKFEDGRYVIYGDYIGESGSGVGDTNNCLSLGLLRMLFKGMLEVSEELNVDVERRKKWRHILDHLSEFPTATVDGVRRIRGAEAGPSATDRIGPGRPQSRVEMMGIVFPSGVVGLGSDPEFLKVVRDDVRDWPEREWINHFNGFNATFPVAARVGHDPRDIMAKMNKQFSVAGLPNLWVFCGGGGIENCSGVPACVNEMLLQSHEGVLRLFPVWPNDQDARFGNLRAVGAFLVSSEFKQGKVSYVLIKSERGRPCSVLIPWLEEEQARVVRREGEQESPVVVKRDGKRLSFDTVPGGVYLLRPSTE